MEKWKPIPNYDLYEINYLGQIRNKKTSRILKAFLNKDLLCVNLYYEAGKFRQEIVSRLVVQSFGNLIQDWVVCHLDGNPLNNHIDNLDCIPRKDLNLKNLEGCYRKTKISASGIEFILSHYRKSCRTYGSGALALKFGVTPTAILKIVNKNKAHRGETPGIPGDINHDNQSDPE